MHFPDAGSLSFGAMRRASERRGACDGVFVACIEAIGIFCRPSCAEHAPARDQVEFLAGAKEAMAHGYRPCPHCRPMEPVGETPPEIRSLIEELEDNPPARLNDGDLRDRGLDPAAIRRWFRKHHDMTFHAYRRGLRMSGALRQLAAGDGANGPASVNGAGSNDGGESVTGFQEAVRQITGSAPRRRRGDAVVHLSLIPTPLGPMLAGTTEEGVCLLEFTDRRMLPTQLQRLEKRLRCVFLPRHTDVSRLLEMELTEYLDGALVRFSVPIDLQGTPFQERVWNALMDIPHGEVRSYLAQAKAIGAPKAVRAVARANGDNRIAILVPCHRVIGSDGSLTGYGGGLWRKRHLLDLERSGVTGDLFAEPAQG